jgi:hypothetical protein
VSNKRQCCCGPQDCPDGNCPAIDADCATKGLQPFTLLIEATATPSSCNSFTYETLNCCPPNCLSWENGFGAREGCLPCDPDIGCEPCQADMPEWEPPGCYQFPVRECQYADPRKNSEVCEFSHMGFWTSINYTPDECLPLGSVLCRDLVFYPPGVFTVSYLPMVGSTQNLYGGFSNCVSGEPQALPQTGGPVFGWPCDCGVNPTCTVCPCACQCNAIWPEYVLNPLGWDPADGTFTARVLWVAPCGGSRPFQTPTERATFNCGGGCDCDGAYIAIGFGASFVARMGYDGENLFPGGDAAFPMTGAANDGGASTVCDSYIATEPGPTCFQIFSGTNVQQVCNPTRNWEIVFRRKMDINALPSANKCAMLKGEYEPVGLVICNNGPHGPVVCCDVLSEDCQDAALCYDSLEACASPAQWRDYLWKTGLSNIRVIVQ